MDNDDVRSVLVAALDRAFEEGVAPFAPLAQRCLRDRFSDRYTLAFVMAFLEDHLHRMFVAHDPATEQFWKGWFTRVAAIPLAATWQTPLDAAAVDALSTLRDELDARPAPHVFLRDLRGVPTGTYPVIQVEFHDLPVRAAVIAVRATCVQIVPLRDDADLPHPPVRAHPRIAFSFRHGKCELAPAFGYSPSPMLNKYVQARRTP